MHRIVYTDSRVHNLTFVRKHRYTVVTDTLSHIHSTYTLVRPDMCFTTFVNANIEKNVPILVYAMRIFAGKHANIEKPLEYLHMRMRIFAQH